MATSNVTTLTYTRDQIINSALRKTGIFSRFESPEAEDIEDAAEALNLFILSINTRSDGMPNPKLWVRQRALLVLEKEKHKYILGGDNSALLVQEHNLYNLGSTVMTGVILASGAATNVVAPSTASPGFSLTSKMAVRHPLAGSIYELGSVVDFNITGGIVTPVADAEFAASTGWTLGTGWTISGGKAASDGTQTAVSLLSCSPTILADTSYTLLIHVDSITSGSIVPVLGGLRGEAITTAGFHVRRFRTVGAGTFALEASVNFIGSVEKVTVQLATDSLSFWTAGTSSLETTGTSSDFYFYTEKAGKPLDILTMSLRDITGNQADDMRIHSLNSSQYDTIPDKSSPGDPTAYYYEEKRDHGLLYLDCADTNLDDQLLITYIAPLKLFTAPDDEADFVPSAYEMLVYNLAVRYAADKKKTVPANVAQLAAVSLGVFANDDPETSFAFFEPDRVPNSGGYWSSD